MHGSIIGIMGGFWFFGAGARVLGELKGRLLLGDAVAKNKVRSTHSKSYSLVERFVVLLFFLLVLLIFLY